MVLSSFIGHSLGSAAIGKFNLIYAAFMVCFVISDFGASKYLPRQFVLRGEANDVQNGLIKKINGYKFLMSLFIFPLGVYITRLVGYDMEVQRYLIFLLILLPIIHLISTAQAMLISKEDTIYIGYGALIAFILTLIGSIVGVSWGNLGLKAIIFSIVIGKICELLYLSRINLNFCNIRFAGFLKISKELNPFAMQTFLSIGYSKFALLIVGSFLSMSEMGVLGVGSTVMGLCSLYAVSSATRLYPKLVQGYTNKDSQFIWNNIKVHINHSLIFVIPLTLFGLAFSGQLLRILFGIDNQVYILPFQLMLVCAPFTILNSLHGFLYYAAHQERLVVSLSWITMSMSLFFTYFLGKQYGIKGAALAFLLAETVTLLVFYSVIFLKKRLFCVRA